MLCWTTSHGGGAIRGWFRGFDWRLGRSMDGGKGVHDAGTQRQRMAQRERRQQTHFPRNGLVSIPGRRRFQTRQSLLPSSWRLLLGSGAYHVGIRWLKRSRLQRIWQLGRLVRRQIQHCLANPLLHQVLRRERRDRFQVFMLGYQSFEHGSEGWCRFFAKCKNVEESFVLDKKKS